jgi:hypothetical protein
VMITYSADSHTLSMWWNGIPGNRWAKSHR